MPNKKIYENEDEERGGSNRPEWRGVLSKVQSVPTCGPGENDVNHCPTGPPVEVRVENRVALGNEGR